jgi:hypothetical protein
MQKKQRKFADDGWAIWIEGDDTSTVYINDWINPKGKSFVDVAVRIRGIKASRVLNIYVPFLISQSEIEDVSLYFKDAKVLQAIFSSACIIDFKKNEYTSEIAYNGKTIDIIHVDAVGFNISEIAKGTLISVNIEKIQSFIDNDEAYFILRMPHKTLNEIFIKHTNVKNFFSKLKDLITTPVVSEKYVYSVRINESRLLPEEITRIGAFHRQKLKKAVVTLSINENYELDDSNCFRVHRLEEVLYKEYLPDNYKSDNVIIYYWHQNQDYNLQGKFNFFYTIFKNEISKKSMLVYIILIITLDFFGNLLYGLFEFLLNFISRG